MGDTEIAREMTHEIPCGAVLVLGGGIGGMQAALDCADSGFKVYLVEKDPCIGGMMAQLDKTFPTNDCAMCTMAPRLAGVSRHLNIEMITGAELVALEGKPGRFTATVTQKPRFIDVSRCTGCALCEAECPVILPRETDGGLSTRKAIYRRYPQAVPAAFSIDKKGTAPCRHTCPAHLSVQGYMALTAQGKFREALEVIYKDIPFAGVCGRICPHTCEERCSRGDDGEALSIRSVKRFLADRLPDFEVPLPEQESDRKVALVGGGPSSFTAAYHLRRMGYGATVFERLPQTGGMLRWGVPPFRLPRDVIDEETGRIVKMNAHVETGVNVGSDVTLQDLAARGFDAVYIATGLPKSRALGYEGEDSPQVLPLLEFLTKVYTNKISQMKGTVAVIGGGNTAVDAARTALRLGASKVTMVFLETRKVMPAYEEEVADALAEGVILRESTSPRAFAFEKGTLTGLKVQKVTLAPPESEGLPFLIAIPGGKVRPVPVTGTEEVIPCDAIITAIGQQRDDTVFSGLADDIVAALLKDGTASMPFEGREITLLAGGDLKRGPASAIEAMADGKRAAMILDCLFRNEPPPPEESFPEPVKAELDEDEPFSKRIVPPRAVLSEAVKDFREIEKGFTEQQVMTEATRCLSCGICSECMRCEEVCEAKAICHDAYGETTRSLEVGALIMAPGFSLFDAAGRHEYGLGRWKNVVTSLQFERILSAGGPTMGALERPGDHRLPSSVAFLQCVGSREEERQFCSSVCCMYATKQALLVKEHHPEVHAEVFYIDLRAFGKGFENFYERAKQAGVAYTRTNVSMLKEEPVTGNLLFTVREEDGSLKERRFEMVVLSCGLSAPESFKRLAEVTGIETDPYGFCRTETFAPLDTSREGIFVCGAFQEPKDIPETVSQASAAAGRAAGLLAASRHTLVKIKEYPPERPVEGEEARVGVFICHCGKNIGGVLDIPSLVREAAALGLVAHAEENLYTCSSDSLEKIRATIKEKNLNRVVVASCTPRTHEALFQEALREAGLNPYLFEMANIRDQCSWVHAHETEKAGHKAVALIRAAVAKARLLAPLREAHVPVKKAALVVGGGLAGLTAALELAGQGFPVSLVERSDELGGMVKKIHTTDRGEDTAAFIGGLAASVKSHPLVTVYTDAALKEFKGFQGNFNAVIATGEGDVSVEAGAAIVATGAVEHSPKEYLYGSDSRVMTLMDLEGRLALKDEVLVKAREIAFIQCVGSRNEERPYCSRICCTGAVKRAILLKEQNPAAAIYILYRDIRTFGFREELYARARERGIIFIHHADSEKPVLDAAGGTLSLTVRDTTLGCTVKLSPDLVVLSAATVPSPGAEAFVEIMKVPVTADGFFLEAHMKLRPVEFASKGIFLCGTAHYPKFMDETVAQACAAAERAATILSRDFVEVEGIVARVNSNKCIACLTCVRSCPYNVPKILHRTRTATAAYIEEAECHGCGTCASECPAKAITLLHYSDAEVFATSCGLLAPEECPGGVTAPGKPT
ncbi:MAG: FAD-dependent oxidoreductase [Candidatus Eremiobacteraeota bacterium]|nr:FAD-dependent oxidoreductase [Candidatus Eremiobacteraeota bacterium]